MSNQKKAHVLSSFNDVGTGESFEAGAMIMLDAGTFANYEHAGIVSAHAPEAKSAPAKKRSKRAKKPTPAKAPEPPVSGDAEPEA